MQQAAIVSPGELIRHKLFHYRGVVYDVDPHFMLSEEWYENVAKSRPPKDEPWYRVLVHGTNQETYVAQCNLEPDTSGEPIDHPSIDQYFTDFDAGRYQLRTASN